MEKCRDARGAGRPMIPWWAKKVKPGLSVAHANKIQARAMSMVNAAGGAAGATMGILFAGLMGMANVAGIAPTWWYGLILGPLGWPIAWAFMSRGLKRVRGMVLTEGFCPSCAAPITGLAPDTEDGCTVCPGCGAAWRVDPVGAVVKAPA